MLRAMSSLSREEDSSAFLNFSKTMTFSRKSTHKKTKTICLVMCFSTKTTKKNNMKKVRLCFEQARN